MKMIRCIAIISIIMMIAQSASAQGITDMAYVRGSLVISQTINTATWTKINFVALQDDYDNWDNGVFSPSHNGRYVFCANLLWDAMPGISEVIIRLYLSDGRGYQFRTRDLGGGSTQKAISISGCVSLWLTTSISAQFEAYQASGADQSLDASPTLTFFTVVEVPMVAISQTATPQPTMTPNATIPALVTIIAGLISPTVTATMEPITETINISLAITNTTGISISRIPVSNTLHTTGYIYLPGWVLNFDPIAVIASLMIFIVVGAVMRKPTLFVISWFGLSILGVFSQSGIYWVFITIVMVAAVVIYLFFRHTQES